MKDLIIDWLGLFTGIFLVLLGGHLLPTEMTLALISMVLGLIWVWIAIENDDEEPPLGV